jgi:S-adenosylmethionine:tRNA ribosyltransferase-isomerase
MRTSELDYPLPKHLIARRPTAERDGARLLVLGQQGIADRHVTDWPDLLVPGALVVLNETRVIKARLIGQRRGTGGRVELLLLRRADDQNSEEEAVEQTWEALGRPSRPLRAGVVVDVGPLMAHVVEQRSEGVVLVKMVAPAGVLAAVDACGHIPLPPYLGREDDAEDPGRYQTVYARCPGSVAAPTAGLHLSERLLSRLRERDIRCAKLVLHVGQGTFRPVKAEDLGRHVMHAERFFVGSDLVREVADARARGAPVVAVGTTVVRALESAAIPDRTGFIGAVAGETSLLIQPGYRFRVVDALLTNFHLPRSTLLALVAAFAGLERVKEAYRAATDRQYRFFSYGDAMWIPERLAC